jgi:hypothetical protein
MAKLSARPVAKLRLNIAQMYAVAAQVRTLMLEWGRGTGKSTVLGYFMRGMATTMPRGKFYLVGTSYKAMLSDTLPSTLEGLERLGLYNGIHYHIGRPGPKHWERPYQPPTDWSNFIHFWTGAAVQLVSQDKGKVEQRGPNYDAGLGDEVAQLDERRLMNECHAGMRTRREQFEKSPFYLMRVYASSTPVTRSGLWMLKYEELARDEAIARKRGDTDGPQQYAFLRANAWLANRHNLAKDWFEQMRRDAPSEAMYQAEIMNVRPSMVVNSFYPKLDADRHYYSADDPDYWLGQIIDRRAFAENALRDMDYDRSKPLVVCFDPGAAINVAVVKQIHWDLNEQRTIRCFWRKAPAIVQDLFREDVIPYYDGAHKHKVVELFFDPTARNRSANSRSTVLDDVVALWRKAGWVVKVMQPPRRVLQDEKYHLISKVHAEEPGSGLLKSRINKHACRDLIVSLENTEALEKWSNGVRTVGKDKRSESRKGSVPRQHATDLGDAYDLSEWYYARERIRAGKRTFGDVRLIG